MASEREVKQIVYNIARQHGTHVVHVALREVRALASAEYELQELTDFCERVSKSLSDIEIPRIMQQRMRSLEKRVKLFRLELNV